MKLSKIVHLIMLLTCMPFAAAFADHTNPGSEQVQRLTYDAQQLNYLVQRSYLRYPVKSEVARFSIEVNRLANCYSMPLSSAETIQPMDHQDHDHNDGMRCAYQLQRVQQAWYPVERYLYDTYSDMPQLYQLYMQTRQDLYSLLGQ